MSYEEWQSRVSRRLGTGNALVFQSTQTEVVIKVPCCRGHIVDVHCKPHKPIEHVVQKMLNDGWTIGRKLICPKHARKRRPEREQDQREEMMDAGAAVHEQEEIEMAETPTPSDAARAKKREAMELLTLAFKLAPDGKTGQYEGGYSDASIAKETGLSEAAIHTMREEYFAPLGEPTELVEFREALKQCRNEIAAGAEAARNAVRALELRLDRIASKFGLKE